MEMDEQEQQELLTKIAGEAGFDGTAKYIERLRDELGLPELGQSHDNK